MSKRLLDVTVAIVGIVLLSPVFAVLAVLILVFSGGSVLFRQRRSGLHGRDFIMYKFRTMTTSVDAQAGTFDAGETSRVTPIGRVLRQTKLDELPQLWNVLRGEMSLVGPRPEVRKWVDAYPDRWRNIHKVKPGITDPAALIYRHEEDILAASPHPEESYRDVILPDKLALYEDYVRSRTLTGDIAILLRTVGALLRRK